jgi:methionine-rich copper-binding protein CopC
MKRLTACWSAVLALVLIGLVPNPAAAHAILLTSTPAIDGTVSGNHIAIRIKYNSRIDHRRSRLTLSDPSGKKTVLAIDPRSPVDEIDAAADLGPGAYSLRWQVLAVDGHITRGDIPFTVSGK